jgi:hypothetical protein
MTSVHAKYPGTYYVYAMLSRDGEYTDISGCVISNGLPAGDLNRPSYLYPDYGYNYNRTMTLIDAVLRDVNHDERSFTLNITVGPDADRDDTEVVIAYTTDPTLAVTESNIVSGASDLTPIKPASIRTYIPGNVGEMHRSFSTKVTIDSTGTCYVYIMLRNKTGVSVILRRNVYIIPPAPTPTPGP